MSSPGTGFTDEQGRYLAFIDADTRVPGRPPAEADLQRHFRVSPPAVHQMVLTLERAGLIRRQPGLAPGLARSIEVLVNPECLPLRRPPQPVKSSAQRNYANPRNYAATPTGLIGIIGRPCSFFVAVLRPLN